MDGPRTYVCLYWNVSTYIHTYILYIIHTVVRSGVKRIASKALSSYVNDIGVMVMVMWTKFNDIKAWSWSWSCKATGHLVYSSHF
jgi:hypothetical protein